MQPPIHLLQIEHTPIADVPLSTHIAGGAILRVHATTYEDYEKTGHYGRAEVLVAGDTVVEMTIDDQKGWERDRMHMVVATLDADGLPVDDGSDCELMVGDAHFRISATTARRLVAGGTWRIPYEVAAARTPPLPHGEGG